MYDGNIQPYTVWALFLLCTILNVIVMLNLLIAIISESFAHINMNSTLNSMQERARIIAENSYLIPDDKMREISDTKKYILVGLNNEDLNANGIRDSLESDATKTSTKLEARIANLEKIINEKFDLILTELKKP